MKLLKKTLEKIEPPSLYFVRAVRGVQHGVQHQNICFGKLLRIPSRNTGRKSRDTNSVIVYYVQNTQEITGHGYLYPLFILKPFLAFM